MPFLGLYKKTGCMAKKHNIDKFQGYPHYPPNEDITRAKNNNGKEPFGEDNTPREPFNNTVDPRDGEASIVEGTDADINSEDLRMLEAAEQNMDSRDSVNLQMSALDSVDEDGELLNEESSLNRDMTGEDLDMPVSNAERAMEDIGEEDEENNYYSLGGDNHESQEENKGE
jgi:hypothetical protein